MNKFKKWQAQLVNANKRLAPLGMRLTVSEPEEAFFFALHVCGPGADEGFIYDKCDREPTASAVG